MSASHIILDFLHLCAKNCQIWWKFDVVITKIILLDILNDIFFLPKFFDTIRLLTCMYT